MMLGIGLIVLSILLVSIVFLPWCFIPSETENM